MTPFIDQTTDHDRETGGERYVRTLDDRCYVSVLYRLTGFGYHRWETAVVFIHDVEKPKFSDQDFLLIPGDRREELATLTKEELRQWCSDNCEGNPNNLETFIEEIKCGLEVGG